MLRIAIVDPSDYSRDPLRSLLLGIDFVWLEAECSRYEFFPEVVSQSRPDLVVVVLDSDRQRALNTISHLVATYPKLPILTISSDHQAPAIAAARSEILSDAAGGPRGNGRHVAPGPGGMRA